MKEQTQQSRPEVSGADEFVTNASGKMGQATPVVTPELDSPMGSLFVRRWPRWSWLLGHPVGVEVERAVPRRVTRSEYDDVVAAVERFMRLEGRVSEVRGALRWTCGGGLSRTEVESIPMGDRTRLRVVGRYWDTLGWLIVGGLVLGWMPGLVVTAGLELSPGSGAIAIAAGYAVTFFAVRLLWNAVGREEERGLVTLLELVAEHVSTDGSGVSRLDGVSDAGAPSVQRPPT